MHDEDKTRSRRRRAWTWAWCAAIALGPVACSDVLGLDDMSVNANGSATGSAAAGGAGGADAACMACGMAACLSVLAACSADSPTGCKAFLDCIDAEGCSDEACASGCLAAHPAGQVVVDCLCGSCAAECSMYCGTGTGGAGGVAGSAGAPAAGGAGGG